MVKTKPKWTVGVLVALVGLLLLALCVVAMLRRQDVLAGGLAVLGLGAILLAALLPRLSGPVEVGLSGIKLQVVQMAQTGLVAGYSQNEIVAAVDDLVAEQNAAPKDSVQTNAVATAHISLPESVSDQDSPDLVQAELAATYRDEYYRTGNHADLEAAIEAAFQALAMNPAESPWRSPVLGLMGELLLARYEASGDISALDEAVQILQQGLTITPPSSPYYQQILSQLARAVQSRFEKTGELHDQDQVLALLRRLEEIRRRRGE